jgi:hypothetical protein
MLMKESKVNKSLFFAPSNLNTISIDDRGATKSELGHHVKSPDYTLQASPGKTYIPMVLDSPCRIN